MTLGQPAIGYTLAAILGLISLLVLGASFLVESENLVTSCTSYYVGQTFEGGVVTPAYRVTRIQIEEGNIQIFYTRLGYYGMVECRP